jgi:hypothetical protein
MAYERVARLGRGGMGVVDLARRADGTEVALKRLTLHGSAIDMARARQRIRREAEALAGIDHPNVVSLLEVLDGPDDGDGSSGSPDEVVLVMPHLPGGTLADRVGHHGPAPAPEVDRLADALLSGLAAAHRAGVIHRDIKPANVLFDAAGEPQLADFGVAAHRDVTDGLTAAGTVVGTPAFMAPEQARGEPADAAADVFSLGATLLFAATGEGPYGRGDPRLLMDRAARGRVRPIPRSLPPALRRRLRAMLDPRPGRRPTAAALAGGPDGTVALPAARATRRRRRAVAVAVVALLGSGVLAGAVAVRAGSGDGADAAQPAAVPAPPTTAPCVPLPYRPCGGVDAPNTDGVRCTAGFEDYDGDPATGCEAGPDGLPDGTPLVDRIEGTIVPRDDVDRFTVEVEDRWQLLCDGVLTLTLTAPEGMALRLEVLDRAGERLLGEAISTGEPAEVSLPEPSCFQDDSTTLQAVVSPVGSDRVGDPYLLERRGSW